MSLYRNVLTVGGATLVSRVLGFVRDLAIAAVLGGGPAADAFVVAFRLPNLFRRLFAEGAFAAAFVPLFVRRRAEAGDGPARHFAGEAMAVVGVAVVVATALGWVFAPALVDLLAPGFAADPAKRALAVDLSRFCLPYLAAITVVALLSALATADRRFLAPALAPAVLNLVLIAALLGTRLFGGDAGMEGAARVLSAAVTIGGVAQVVFLAVAVARGVGLPPLLAPRLSAPVRRLFVLGVPGLLSGALTEITVVVGTVIASGTAGAVSWLYYADRLYQLPLGVVGIAVGQVLLPEIAHRIAAGDTEGAIAAQNRALELALALALPAALALGVLAEPIVAILFERGAFGAADRLATARALSIYAAGLPAFVVARVATPAYFARENTATPMRIGALAVAVNVGLAVALVPVVGWVAVAVATVVAGWLNVGLLFLGLGRRGHWRADRLLDRRLLGLGLAGAAMAVGFALVGGPLAAALLGATGTFARIGGLAAVVVAGIAAWAGLLVALGIVAPPGRARSTAVDEATCRRGDDAA